MQMKVISDLEYTVSGISVPDFKHRRYCVFDLEATGIDAATEHITQIGAVSIENGEIQTEYTFNCLVKPPKPIPEAVERLTGIYNAELEHAARFKEVYEEFAAFTKDCILITHAGYEFDLPLLEKECASNHLSMLGNDCLDTKALFTYLHPENNHIINTDYLIKHYAINDQDLKRHDALADSILIGRIALRIMEEFENRNQQDIALLDPVMVKRFQINPLV